MAFRFGWIDRFSIAPLLCRHDRTAEFIQSQVGDGGFPFGDAEELLVDRIWIGFIDGCDCLSDFSQVAQKDRSPIPFGLDRLSFAEEAGQITPHCLDRQSEFLLDFRIAGYRFL